MPYRPQPLELLLLVAGIVSLVFLAEALDMSPPLALGSSSGILYLGLLARQASPPGQPAHEAPPDGAQP